MFGGVPRYGMFNQSHFEPSFAERPDMSVAEGKQREGVGAQEWNDEAFERAFDEAQEEVDISQSQDRRAKDLFWDPIRGEPSEDYETQLRLLEQQNKKRVALAEQERAAERQAAQSSSGDVRLGDQHVNPFYDAIHDDPLADQHDILDAIEAESQARFQSALQDLPEQKQGMRPPDHDMEADELSKTAGHLLDSVAHDTSDKFQNSSFLALMRRLRDKEVRV
ncbi:MAG: hypothetical protein INR71_11485, partial [Terriglobus roseus]|nr:hypothetical protein [Terriglobus roseus]